MCKCGLNLCQKCLPNHTTTIECRILEKSKEDHKRKSQILTILRLFLAQFENRDLALRLDLLMDHNEDRIDNEEDETLNKILCSIFGNEDFKNDFKRLIGG